MNTNANSEADARESARGREIMRLNQLSRGNTTDSLLEGALDGRQRTVESVTRLYSFVLKNFGYGATANKYWLVCGTFLRGSGMTHEELHKIEHPYPAAGEPGFRSILDEMNDEGGH